MEIKYSDAKNKLDHLISNRKSFILIGIEIDDLMDASKLVELAVEAQGLKCRVYTRNRAYAAGALAWTGVGLLASLGSIAIHNLATFNPDYEIGRCVVDNRLYVNYRS